MWIGIMCVVKLKDWKEAKDSMLPLGMNDTIDHDHISMYVLNHIDIWVLVRIIVWIHDHINVLVLNHINVLVLNHIDI